MSKHKIRLISCTILVVGAAGLAAWVRSHKAPQRAQELLETLRDVQPAYGKTENPLAPSPEQVQEDLEALGDTSVPDLIDALDDARVHDLAAMQLGKRRDPRAVIPLIDHLKSPRHSDTFFERKALEGYWDPAVFATLGAHERAAIVEWLIAVLRQQGAEQYDDRCDAARVLLQLGDPRAADALFAVIDDESIKALERTRRQQNESTHLRAFSAQAVGTLKYERAFDTLSRLIQTDENPEVRRQSAYGLWKLGDPRAMELLEEAAAGSFTPPGAMPEQERYDWGMFESAAKEALDLLRQP